jgi:hypothetical protein
MRSALGPNIPLNQWVPEVVSSRVNRPGHVAEHSRPSNAKVKNDEDITRKIWGFHGGDYEEWCLLGCYAVWLL